ncbi:MAG: hypothetical protein IJU76_05570 [Desulfovibrionaceae bacterium]|nr:hypothetical protein [Desulfovibrionaceae bacterium]
MGFSVKTKGLDTGFWRKNSIRAKRGSMDERIAYAFLFSSTEGPVELCSRTMRICLTFHRLFAEICRFFKKMGARAWFMSFPKDKARKGRLLTSVFYTAER